MSLKALAPLASTTVSDALIKAEPLFETSDLVAMGADAPLAMQKFVNLRKLNGRRMVVLPEDSEYGSVIWKALRKQKVEPILIGEARTHESLCKMVEASAGITLVDRTTATGFFQYEYCLSSDSPANNPRRRHLDQYTGGATQRYQFISQGPSQQRP